MRIPSFSGSPCWVVPKFIERTVLKARVSAKKLDAFPQGAAVRAGFSLPRQAQASSSIEPVFT
ncbi:MAG: hypothetical protein ACK512_00435, partial [Cyanobium sp.]